MNTESLQDENAPKTIGQKLREAREKLGLTQQNVAEHLCLRVATIADLEDDKNSTGLAPTFINGYVRAYARYVNLPESEIIVSAKAEPIKAQLSRPSPSPNSAPKHPKRELKSASVKGFPLNKTTTHKKRDSILMFLTWFILLGVIGLSGVWWWQNYQLKAQDIDKMDENSTIQLNIARNEGRVVPLADSSAGANVIVLPSQDATSTLYSAPANENGTRITTDTVSPSALFQQRLPFFPNPRSGLTAEAVAQMKVLANTLTMNFSDSSWVTITHRVNGRTVTLFSGQKKRGESLEVSGTPPYRITLGKPAAVKVEFGGKTVPSQARFTLNAAS